jgi:transcriptional regulator with XRE-family HTH domain
VYNYGTMEPEVQRLINILRTAMRILGVSNRDVERKLGMSPSYLSRVFSGGIELKAEHLVLIPRAMGLEPAEFFHLAYPPRRSAAASSASTQLQQALRDLQPAPQEAPPAPADTMSDEQLQRVLFSTLKKFMGREGEGTNG